MRRKYLEVEKKARRRIYRQIKTGIKQARVRGVKENKNIFVYVVKHGGASLKFKVDKATRLRLCK